MRAICLLMICGALAWPAPRVNFRRDVAPILETRCVRCHGADRAMHGLRLDDKLFARLALVPKKPDESRLYNAAKSGYMPPGGPKLPAKEVETLRLWIAQGARWPKGVELHRP